MQRLPSFLNPNGDLEQLSGTWFSFAPFGVDNGTLASFTADSVPEPATLSLLGSLAGVGFMRRKKNWAPRSINTTTPTKCGVFV
jgi:hypothetical protein